MRRAAVLLLAALGLAAGACGGDDESASTATVRTESPSLVPSPTPTPTATPEATPTATEPTATAPSAPSPPPDADPAEDGGGGGSAEEEQEGGAGDEEAARIPVILIVDGEGITPPTVAVPAFLALEVTVRNDLPRAIRVRVEGAGTVIRVPPRSTRTRRLPGRRAGRYTVDAGAAGRAAIVSGAAPGP